MRGSKRITSVLRSKRPVPLINVHRGSIVGGCSPLRVRLAASFRNLRQQGLAKVDEQEASDQGEKILQVPEPLWGTPRRPWQIAGGRCQVPAKRTGLG